MTKQNGDIVGFTFQEIPLEDALNVILAGDGNYAEVKAMLLEKLPNLEAGKAFAFGLPNGKEVHESQRRGLCMGINTTLKRAKILWRVTYSTSRKLFICVPKSAPRVYEKHTNGSTPQPRHNQEHDALIKQLWEKGSSVAEIISNTKAEPSRVRYICYTLYPRKHLKATPALIEPKQGLDGRAVKDMQMIVAKASRQFGITAEEIANKAFNKNNKAVRKAICVVATQRDIPAKTIATFVGITDDGVKFNAKQTTEFAKKEIGELQQVLGR